MRRAGSQVRDGGFQPLRPSRVPRGNGARLPPRSKTVNWQSATDTPHENRQTPRRDSFAHLIGQKRRRCRLPSSTSFWLARSTQGSFLGDGRAQRSGGRAPTSSTPCPTPLPRRAGRGLLRGGCHVAGQRFSAYKGAQYSLTPIDGRHLRGHAFACSHSLSLCVIAQGASHPQVRHDPAPTWGACALAALSPPCCRRKVYISAR